MKVVLVRPGGGGVQCEPNNVTGGVIRGARVGTRGTRGVS